MSYDILKLGIILSIYLCFSPILSHLILTQNTVFIFFLKPQAQEEMEKQVYFSVFCGY